MNLQLSDHPCNSPSDFPSPMIVTSLRKTEERFEEDQRISKEVINGLPGIFFLLDNNMKFLRWNKNLVEITGYSSEELAAMHPLDFFAGAEKEGIAGKFCDVLEKGESSIEAQIVTKNCEKKPYSFSASRIFINDTPYLMAIGIDIVERHEKEELLRTLSRAVEQSASSIAITATDGTIEYVNPKFCQISGYALDEVIGQNPLENGLTGQLADIFGDAWEIISSGGEWRGERQIRPKSGGSIWVSATISPIRNAENEISHYLSVKEDVTARKKAVYELQKNKAELLVKHEQMKSLLWQMERAKKEWENTMDCVGDIIILTDSDNGIRRCNKAVLEFTGATHKDILGKKWQELLSGQGISIPSPCAAGTELCHLPSGRWFIFNSYPFTDSSCSAVSGAVITLHDNTVLKRFTSELEKAYSDLKATQAKVVQQEKMASIGQLAAGVAHEINNPMGFISSNLGTLAKYIERLNDFIQAKSEAMESLQDKEVVDALRDKRKTLKVDYILEDGKELIKESLDGAERVRTIVKNLKSFSRVDEAECKDADINECITSTINIVWNELKYKVQLVKELGEIPLVKCHPQQLNQVFMNLLVNAGQAIEKQGEITVRTWHESDSIYASISDNGCGMTPEVINRIFEPFYTTKEVGKGTGLGLSITYDIIKKHNGEIIVESEPGSGTIFTVRLPVVKGE